MVDVASLRTLAEKLRQGAGYLSIDTINEAADGIEAMLAWNRLRAEDIMTLGKEVGTLTVENGRLRADRDSHQRLAIQMQTALGNIAKADPVDLALDPEWPQRVALAAIPANP